MLWLVYREKRPTSHVQTSDVDVGRFLLTIIRDVLFVGKGEDVAAGAVAGGLEVVVTRNFGVGDRPQRLETGRGNWSRGEPGNGVSVVFRSDCQVSGSQRILPPCIRSCVVPERILDSWVSFQFDTVIQPIEKYRCN